MNGYTVSLPFAGTIRRHEWQPAKAEQGKAKAKPASRENLIEARIMALLAATPEGTTALEVRTALKSITSKMSRLDKINLLGTDGNRENMGRVYKIKQKPAPQTYQ